LGWTLVNRHEHRSTSASSHGDGSWVVSRDELLGRYAALPGTFPHTKRYAAELTAGTGHDRFDFTPGGRRRQLTSNSLPSGSFMPTA
jgi:hypothetical protein